MFCKKAGNVLTADVAWECLEPLGNRERRICKSFAQLIEEWVFVPSVFGDVMS
jgi:hypothetical protein